MEVRPKKDQAKASAACRQNAEGSAGIPDVGNTEQIGNDGDRLMQPHGLHDIDFGDLVDHDNPEADQAQQHISRCGSLHPDSLVEEFTNRFYTSVTQRGMVRIGSHGWAIIPTTVAFLAHGLFHHDREIRLER